MLLTKDTDTWDHGTHRAAVPDLGALAVCADGLSAQASLLSVFAADEWVGKESASPCVHTQHAAACIVGTAQDMDALGTPAVCPESSPGAQLKAMPKHPPVSDGHIEVAGGALR